MNKTFASARILAPALALSLAQLLAGCGEPAGDGATQDGQVAADTAAQATPSAAAPSVTATGADSADRPAAFAQCAACHSTEPGRNGIGPSLAGAFGRAAAQGEGFAYSEAMRSSGLTWDAATLDTYLTSPMKMVPGTRMAFAGLADADQRKAVIAYLETLK